MPSLPPNWIQPSLNPPAFPIPLELIFRVHDPFNPPPFFNFLLSIMYLYHSPPTLERKEGNEFIERGKKKQSGEGGGGRGFLSASSFGVIVFVPLNPVSIPSDGTHRQSEKRDERLFFFYSFFLFFSFSPTLKNQKFDHSILHHEPFLLEGISILGCDALWLWRRVKGEGWNRGQ
ncbi:hypothetical protein IE53DRAFT_183674 [Violaceomyces palustris]|uniref:Uncharacterized protein n=1 Tax=Violaceomyces palustris TaxID=1673888 RepID=A0ACD0P5R9_9BASI|nr:hypothetical protein IE53DRAFT_183674 [Violaceomyces palustris]